MGRNGPLTLLCGSVVCVFGAPYAGYLTSPQSRWCRSGGVLGDAENNALSAGAALLAGRTPVAVVGPNAEAVVPFVQGADEDGAAAVTGRRTGITVRTAHRLATDADRASRPLPTGPATLLDGAAGRHSH